MCGGNMSDYYRGLQINSKPGAKRNAKGYNWTAGEIPLPNRDVMYVPQQASYPAMRKKAKQMIDDHLSKTSMYERFFRMPLV